MPPTVIPGVTCPGRQARIVPVLQMLPHIPGRGMSSSTCPPTEPSACQTVPRPPANHRRRSEYLATLAGSAPATPVSAIPSYQHSKEAMSRQLSLAVAELDVDGIKAHTPVTRPASPKQALLTNLR